MILTAKDNDIDQVLGLELKAEREIGQDSALNAALAELGNVLAAGKKLKSLALIRRACSFPRCEKE